MGGTFQAVEPMTSAEIERIAWDIREFFGMGTKNVQMVNLVERILPEGLADYDFFVLPDEDMPGLAGITGTSGEEMIILSESTYIALCNNDREARYVAAHEFGHLVLHSQQTPMLAKRTRNDNRVDPEWQADRFADVWLVPTEGVRKCRSARHVAAKYNVTDELAQRRWQEVMIEGIQGELF
ncbi:Zn-dependent peptidase ImmA (M78 family) [Novosphingobium sp. SG720]|nr:Zn-dependent peptidase ImmA (M78 family) [Novosphingobium sp. SG720]